MGSAAGAGGGPSYSPHNLYYFSYQSVTEARNAEPVYNGVPVRVQLSRSLAFVVGKGVKCLGLGQET